MKFVIKTTLTTTRPRERIDKYVAANGTIIAAVSRRTQLVKAMRNVIVATTSLDFGT
jgi:hypothetical protein